MKQLQLTAIALLALCLLWYATGAGYQSDRLALLAAVIVNALYAAADRSNAIRKLQSMLAGSLYPARGLVFCIVTVLPLLLQLSRKIAYPHIQEQLAAAIVMGVLMVFNFGLAAGGRQ